MPIDRYGQMLTFASHIEPDQKYSEFVYVTVYKGETIQQLAARLGRPEAIQQILELNRRVKLNHHHYLRSALSKLQQNQKIKVPGTMGPLDSFSVLCGDNRPIVKNGYAKYDTVNRPGRVGLNRFLGYDPIEIDCEVRFEAWLAQDGTGIESAIKKLERMAGRGDYEGAADGPPAVVSVTAADAGGNVVPLVGPNYQWSKSNPTAPLYRIGGIEWKEGALSDNMGRRIRADAVITLRQYTPLTIVKRSVAQRQKKRKAGH